VKKTPAKTVSARKAVVKKAPAPPASVRSPSAKKASVNGKTAVKKGAEHTAKATSKVATARVAGTRPSASSQKPPSQKKVASKTVTARPVAKGARPAAAKNARPINPTVVAQRLVPEAAAHAVATPPEPARARKTSSAKSRASARAQAAYAAPAPLPAPTSRFADRFAPPRPPTRQMNILEFNAPKQTKKPNPKLANAWKAKPGHDLTDEEVLAMPDGEYMNEKQLVFFRAKLSGLKDSLLSNAGVTTEHLREDTTVVPDPADRATIEEEHALELRTRDRERKLLKKISQALARIESGEYGFCEETGEPIGLGRLIARPTATLALEAQQRRELKQKMFGD